MIITLVIVIKGTTHIFLGIVRSIIFKTQTNLGFVIELNTFKFSVNSRAVSISLLTYVPITVYQMKLRATIKNRCYQIIRSLDSLFNSPSNGINKITICIYLNL